MAATALAGDGIACTGTGALDDMRTGDSVGDALVRCTPSDGAVLAMRARSKVSFQVVWFQIVHFQAAHL